MFQFLGNSSSGKALVAAIGRSQAVIEFNLDGTIITANENFLNALGYSLDEIQGKHHSMFVDAGGARQRGLPGILGGAEPRRVPGRASTSGSARAARRSGSRPPTIRSSTARQARSRSSSSPPTSPRRRSAHGRRRPDRRDQPRQAVIEFELDGTIITANENFLGALGYTLDEIKGKHHSMFVDADVRATARPIANSGRG